MPISELKHSTLRNLGAAGSAQIILRLLSVARYIILARLLEPAEFGLFALASAWLAVSKRFDDFGIESALIQRKELPPDMFRGGLLFRYLSAVLIFLLIFSLAPLLETFYGMSSLSSVLRTLSLVLLLRLPALSARIDLTRRLNFKSISFIQILSGTGGILITLALAFSGFGVWSLVWGTLSGTLLNTLLFYIKGKKTPAVYHFDFKSIDHLWKNTKEIRKFARPVFGASLVGFLVTQLDDLIVGKLLGVVELGFYTVAFTWANLCVTAFVNLTGKIFFSTISRIQEQIDKVRRGYLSAVKWTALIIIPVNLGLFALAPDFILNVLGEKWLPSVSVIRVLCLYGILRGMGGIGGSFRKALGRPEIFFKLGLLFLAIFLLGVFPLTLKFGITGTAFAVLIPSLIVNVIVFFYNLDLLQMKPGAFFAAVRLPVSFSILFSMILFFLNKQISFWGALPAGLFIYALFLMFFYRDDLRRLWQNMKKVN